MIDSSSLPFLCTLWKLTLMMRRELFVAGLVAVPLGGLGEDVTTFVPDILKVESVLSELTLDLD